MAVATTHGSRDLNALEYKRPLQSLRRLLLFFLSSNQSFKVIFNKNDFYDSGYILFADGRVAPAVATIDNTSHPRPPNFFCQFLFRQRQGDGRVELMDARHKASARNQAAIVRGCGGRWLRDGP
ncbi:hypothetical protein RJ55_00961 [Drechmeria coniospora]|nr:hypothetical protein RJ55_00961 [Drechmeria coniospora]